MTRSLRGHLGRLSLGLYRLSQRGWAKAFSMSIAGSFASFGARTVVQPPVRLLGEHRIALGEGVFVGAGSWLQTLEEPSGGAAVAIEIGAGTSIAGNCVVSAVESVRVGPRVLIARGVYISDHSHGIDDVGTPVLDQGVTKIRPVEIADGAWLGENVVVCPGVRVGRGAVVGANSVVLDDVPDHCVAAGAPARVLRHLDPGSRDS